MLLLLLLPSFAWSCMFVVCCVQYGIKKRDSEATLNARDDGRKKLSSAGLSGDLQTNQGFCTFTACCVIRWLFGYIGNTIQYKARQ